MIGKLKTVIMDAPEVEKLSAFYQALAGWSVQSADPEWATLITDDGWEIGIQHAPDHVPPQWPSQAHPQQAHLDLRMPDIDAGSAKAIELGATRVGGGESWHTLTDPAGHPFDLCLKAEDPRTTLMGITLDCPNSKELSAFYAELLGKPVTYESEGMAMVGNDGEHPVLFQQVESYTAPQWPDPLHPQQFHLDVEVADLDAAEKAALALGATRLPGGGKGFRVYADPAGKPFCLTL